MAKKTYRLLQYEKFFSTENLAAYPHLNGSDCADYT